MYLEPKQLPPPLPTKPPEPPAYTTFASSSSSYVAGPPQPQLQYAQQPFKNVYYRIKHNSTELTQLSTFYYIDIKNVKFEFFRLNKYFKIKI